MLIAKTAKSFLFDFSNETKDSYYDNIELFYDHFVVSTILKVGVLPLAVLINNYNKLILAQWHWTK